MTGLDALIKFAEIHDELSFVELETVVVQKKYYVDGIPMHKPMEYQESHVMLRVPVFNGFEIETYEDRLFIRYIPNILERCDAGTYEWPDDWRDPRFEWPKYSRDPRLKNIRKELQYEPRMDFGPGVILPKRVKLVTIPALQKSTIRTELSKKFTDMRDVNLAMLEDGYRSIRYLMQKWTKDIREYIVEPIVPTEDANARQIGLN